jgi:tetratricopeptide (TPR) repeat protein
VITTKLKNRPTLILLASLGFFLLSCGAGKELASEKSTRPAKTLSEKEAVQFGRTYMDATREKILGNYEKAMELYKAALSINPYSAAANYELGLTYNHLGNPDLAFEQFRIASKQEPSNYWYKLSYATFLESGGNIQEAIKEFKELIELNPAQIELKYELSKLLLSSGKTEEGIAYLNEIEQEIGVTEEISFLKQRIYLSKNDVDAAAKEIRLLSEAYPNELKYYGILADIYLSNGKKEKAWEVYQQMEKIAPDNYLVQFSLAEYYRSEGKHEEYLVAIQKAFGNSSMDIDDKVKYILTFYQVDSKDQKRKEEGILLCKTVAQAHPNNAKSHALLADFLYFDNQVEAAKKSYQKTIELDSSRFPVWNQLLVILSETNDIKALLNYAERAVGLFPNQPTVYLLYGLGLSQDKQYEKAIEYYQLGKDLVIDNPTLKGQIYSSLGDAYHSLKKHKESDLNYDRALELDPNNVYVLNNYSYYLSLRKENLDKAKSMSLKSNTLAPNQSSFQDTYAWILYQLEDYEEAQRWIDKALENDAQKSATLLEHKGDILFKLGEKEAALEYWKMAQEKGDASEFIDQKVNEKQLYE